jgi:hypothetical protein
LVSILVGSHYSFPRRIPDRMGLRLKEVVLKIYDLRTIFGRRYWAKEDNIKNLEKFYSPLKVPLFLGKLTKIVNFQLIK